MVEFGLLGSARSQASRCTMRLAPVECLQQCGSSGRGRWRRGGDQDRVHDHSAVRQGRDPWHKDTVEYWNVRGNGRRLGRSHGWGGGRGGASQGLQGTTRLLVTGGRWADGWTPAWLLVEPVLLCVAVVSLVGAVRNTLTT